MGPPRVEAEAEVADMRMMTTITETEVLRDPADGPPITATVAATTEGKISSLSFLPSASLSSTTFCKHGSLCFFQPLKNSLHVLSLRIFHVDSLSYMYLSTPVADSPINRSLSRVFCILHVRQSFSRHPLYLVVSDSNIELGQRVHSYSDKSFLISHFVMSQNLVKSLGFST